MFSTEVVYSGLGVSALVLKTLCFTAPIINADNTVNDLRGRQDILSVQYSRYLLCVVSVSSLSSHPYLLVRREVSVSPFFESVIRNMLSVVQTTVLLLSFLHGQYLVEYIPSQHVYFMVVLLLVDVHTSRSSQF